MAIMYYCEDGEQGVQGRKKTVAHVQVQVQLTNQHPALADADAGHLVRLRPVLAVPVELFGLLVADIHCANGSLCLLQTNRTVAHVLACMK